MVASGCGGARRGVKLCSQSDRGLASALPASMTAASATAFRWVPLMVLCLVQQPARAGTADEFLERGSTSSSSLVGMRTHDTHSLVNDLVVCYVFPGFHAVKHKRALTSTCARSSFSSNGSIWLSYIILHGNCAAMLRAAVDLCSHIKTTHITFQSLFQNDHQPQLLPSQFVVPSW